MADLADLDLMAAVIALQRRLWVAGTRHGYHAITLGWYEGELLRRVDPGHRSLGRYFADEVAAPLGVDFYIGLPDGFDRERLARLHGRTRWQALTHLGEMPAALILSFFQPRSLTYRAFTNPPELDDFNRLDLLRVELPAANGTGEAALSRRPTAPPSPARSA